MALEDWPLVSSESIQDVGLFRLNRDRAINPRTGRERDFFVIHLPDWLQVVPLTADGRLVLIRQYRHASRRVGLEWTNFWQLSRAVGIDFDTTATDARFTDDDPAGDEIPGAIIVTVASGVTVSDLGRWFGSLRLRYFSGGPLIEDGSVTWGPTVLLNGLVGYDVSDHVRLSLEGFNLLNRADEDIAYFYSSRLPGEPLEGIEDIHFHPMEKPSVRVTMTWRF